MYTYMIKFNIILIFCFEHYKDHSEVDVIIRCIWQNWAINL